MCSMIKNTWGRYQMFALDTKTINAFLYRKQRIAGSIWITNLWFTCNSVYFLRIKEVFNCKVRESY